METRSEKGSPSPPLEALLAVSLVAFGIIAAELALTRIFSVLFRSPYVFIIVSGAIGGLGVGGLIAQWVQPAADRLPRWIAGLMLAQAAALAAPVLLLFVLPWGRDLVAHAETGVVVALPMLAFVVAGTLLSLLFRHYAAAGGVLYFADLAAAAAGAPCSVVLLGSLGALNTPLLVSALTAAGAMALAWRAGLRKQAAGGAGMGAALAVLVASNLATGWITLPGLVAPAEAASDPTHPWHLMAKPLFEELGSPFNGSHIVRTDWSAVSRTDVVDDPSQKLFYIYTDGDVPTQMSAWDGSFEHARAEWERFIGWLPFRLAAQPPRRVMAIGSGGGLDVLLALAGGAQEVDAVEINPSIPAVVRDPRFSETYARVYQDPRVRLAVDEGRSFLQRARPYDLIYFACAKTATTQTGGLALLDNHLYTQEAFVDYWRHLTDRGTAALVTQDAFLIDRLLLTALAALRAEGVANAELHLLTARVPVADFPRGPYRFLLMMSRQPWDAAAATAALPRIAATNLEPLYVPHLQPQGASGVRFEPAAELPRIRDALEAQYPINPSLNGGPRASLSTVTDDSPFYVDVAPGLHPFIQELLWGTGAATVAVLGIVLARGLRRRNVPPGARPRTGSLVGAVAYFAALGTGFILVELALMHRFILLLGFPTLSLTVTLFALLLASAAGSRFTQRFPEAALPARLRVLIGGLVALLAAYRWLLPGALALALPLPLAGRIAVTALLIAPVGFLMGMPFPGALRAMGPALRPLVPGLWSVNGATTLLGSVLTMAVAKFVGYSGALLLGAGCYVVAALTVTALRGAPAETAHPADHS
jgi:spermidine synthase